MGVQPSGPCSNPRGHTTSHNPTDLHDLLRGQPQPGEPNLVLDHSHPQVPLTNSPIQTNSVALVREPTIPTEQPPLAGEISANVCGFLDRSLYYFFQVAPQLYSGGWVDSFRHTHNFSENLVAPGTEPRISCSAARNSHHWTIEVD
jgi:hypothetical protein